MSGGDVAFEALIEESLSPTRPEDKLLNQAVLQHMQNLGLDKEETTKVSKKFLLKVVIVAGTTEPVVTASWLRETK